MHWWQRWPLIIGVATFCVVAPTGTSLSPTSTSGADTQSLAPMVTQIGMASWYGSWHHGRRTASGEIFNMYRLTAAHRTLPLGSRVVVTDLVAGRAVEVTINDRGPYVKGRMIDLSYAAAQRLSAVERGVILVELRVVGREPRQEVRGRTTPEPYQKPRVEVAFAFGEWREER
jgi:rare lipoprotein A (peptidoglycan hydrolase)